LCEEFPICDSPKEHFPSRSGSAGQLKASFGGSMGCGHMGGKARKLRYSFAVPQRGLPQKENSTHFLQVGGSLLGSHAVPAGHFRLAQVMAAVVEGACM
jgi:hypothetical protein